MDTTGFNQVGRHGTLSLLKRRSSATPSSSPNDLITSFGIDESPLTFGSTSTCGVRLYYPDIDPLHCQLVFEDGKAFLSIFGKGGVFVDGCWVYPHSSSSEGSPSTPDRGRQQTIIPISNNTEFEIHHKRFRFTYPPKEVRKTLLLATPAPAQKRALRLSMIHSAQVFSPRPSKDPRENLRILQSPLKPGIFGTGSPSKTPARPRAVSPLKYSSKSGSSSDEEEQDTQPEAQKEDDEEEEEIVLVHTNHPRVVEEDRDLVILEDVPMGPLPQIYLATGSPGRLQVPAPRQVPPEQAAPPRTPRRKSLGGTALHRAVLIRSAQRAVWRAEKEKEEEEEREEEMEVLGAVVDPVEVGADGDEDDEYDEQEEEEDQDVVMRSASSEEDDDDEEVTDEEEDAEALAQKAANKSLWRKSLERIIPWGFGAAGDAEEMDDDTHENDEDENDSANAAYTVNKPDDDIEEDENEAPAPLPVRPAQTPIRRPLGSFMTPQAHNPSTQTIGQAKRSIFAATERSRANMAPPGLPEPATAEAPLPPAAAGPGRYSLGGGEARRVLVQQPWRVKDLVLPPGPAGASAPSTAAHASSTVPPATPAPAPVVAPTPRATPAVTEEERRAIQERRRSAVREFKEDTFWKDGAPGMSPAKNAVRMSMGNAGASSSSSARPSSTSPVKQGMRTMQLGAGDADAPSSSSLAMPTPKRLVFGSPTKGRALGYAIAEEGTPSVEESKHKEVEAEDEELDTRSLLDRMRETVDDMKRRRSVVAANTPRVESLAATATVERSVLLRAAPPLPAGTPTSVALATPERPTGSSAFSAMSMGSVKKLDFTRISTPAMRAGSAKPASSSSTNGPAALMAESETDAAVEAMGDAEEEEPFSLLRPAPREVSPTSSRKPSSRGTRGTGRAAKEAEERDEATEDVRAVPLPVVIEPITENAAEEGVQEGQEKSKETKGKAKGRSRLLRAPKPVVTEEVEDIEEMEEVQEPSRGQGKSRAAAKPRSRSAKPPAATAQHELEPVVTLAPTTRRQRSKTPQPPPEQDEVEPLPRSTARRTRKGTVEPEEPAPTPAPTRRGRKAAAEPESEVEGAAEEQEKKTKTPAAKRGRKPRVTPVEEEPEEPEAQLPEPTPVAAPAKRGRAKKAAPAPTPETQDPDEDELDSYEARPSSSKTKSDVPVKAPVKGRKKAAVVKQESDEEHEETEAAPLATARGGRAVKANTTAKTPAAPKTAIPATVPSKIAKPRGKVKTPASLPAAATSRVQTDHPVNTDTAEKENTPGTSGEVAGDDADDAPVKIRMSRRTVPTAAAAGSGKTTRTAVAKSATKSAVKGKVKLEEQQDEEENMGRGRTTRVTRTRTKAV